MEPSFLGYVDLSVKVAHFIVGIGGDRVVHGHQATKRYVARSKWFIPWFCRVDDSWLHSPESELHR
jgi:hypothetical protein